MTEKPNKGETNGSSWACDTVNAEAKAIRQHYLGIQQLLSSQSVSVHLAVLMQQLNYAQILKQ